MPFRPLEVDVRSVFVALALAVIELGEPAP
jgi:hypothetical protein